MVFCNTLNSCRCVEHVLQEQGFATLCYHGEVPKSERKGIIDRFAGATHPLAVFLSKISAIDYEHENHILVSTDLASRGLDIPGHVDHIINFDFPRTAVSLLSQ